MKPKPILLCTLFVLTALLLAGCAKHPGIALTKSASATTFSQPGDIITYSYLITNTGDTTLQNIQLVDGAKQVSCPQTIVFPGLPMTCTMDYSITAEDMIAGQVDTTATVTGWGQGDCCGRSTSVQASSHVLISYLMTDRPALVLVKTADVNSYDQVGDLINYTYTVTNIGNANITDAITVTDDRNQVECPALPTDGLAPKASLACTGTYTITMDDMRAGTVTNTATAQSGDIQSPPATLNISVVANPVLVLVKRVEPASYSYAGESLTYTLTIHNDGNVPLTGPLTIDDKMLSNWKCSVDPIVELLPGDDVVCTATLTVSESAAGSSFKNTATVSLKYGETTITSNEASTMVIAVPTPAKSCSQYTDPQECFNNGCHPDSEDPTICRP